MKSVSQWRTITDKALAERGLLEREAASLSVKVENAKSHLDDLVKARWILSEAVRVTQQKFKEYVESLVTMAIRSVFQERDFKFIVEFDYKRGASECLLMVQEGNKEPYIPKNELGGGMSDILSIALRVVMWSLENPRSNNVLFLDEPTPYIGKETFLQRAGDFIREISNKLKLQIVINTHEPDLMALGDRCWMVTHDGTYSTVRLYKFSMPMHKVGGNLVDQAQIIKEVGAKAPSGLKLRREK